ncbi:putative ankyrin repeat domain protein 17 [Anopheles sinensis]|uniref:Putative ankyrin repeat domain protein 17 n=1 Tax=Anopheles sinensis TaxID=74873 RepID=A0A084W8M3_ANOSI|nr:putative ankyrin repeat domain protein 17 [Anopheles sinensis]
MHLRPRIGRGASWCISHHLHTLDAAHRRMQSVEPPSPPANGPDTPDRQAEGDTGFCAGSRGSRVWWMLVGDKEAAAHCDTDNMQ